MRRRLLAALMAGAMILGGVACDDAPEDETADEDDSNLGPGDGSDEVGPGR